MNHRQRIRVIIMGAAGRDFHNFNTYFRTNESYDVVAFTATQIPNIEGRTYPPELSGNLYPKGISIHPERELAELIHRESIQQVVFAYSDVRHEYVMHLASLVNACGADFRLMGTNETQIKVNKPCVSITAVRTGCGKSQTTRFVAGILKDMGKKVACVRHPMPYGDLTRQICQRFAKLEDLTLHECTIEEREEYEPHIRAGHIVFAGIDYEKIAREAEKEADVILWDGGNNDTSFYKADLSIVVTDPHRPGHELAYYPGETNLRIANLIVVNKVGTAKPENVETLLRNIKEANPKAVVVQAESPVMVEAPETVKGKRVLVIEDGPTLTHGEMTYGAGQVAAEQFGAASIVDPRPYATGSIKGVYEKYTHLTKILPAMGYGQQQIAELEETINKVDCDLVLVGTPIDLAALLKIKKPSLRVFYELEERQQGVIAKVVAAVVK